MSENKKDKTTDIFSQRLKKIMNERNIKQNELCKLTKIKKSSMSHYTNGKVVPKRQKIESIAKALNVSPSYLLGFDDNTSSKQNKQNNQNKQDNHDSQTTSNDDCNLSINEIRILNDILDLIFNHDNGQLIAEQIEKYTNATLEDLSRISSKLENLYNETIKK